ncbi:MAG: 3-hydroxybutyryl-CoA dehydrogenase [Chloroflexi bacterium]|nr:3-hydroxybutyryl-CoA dehydrogenase [Chloroflexota bacterium]
MRENTVGVIGAGTMGAGIAQVAAQAGKHVLLCDVSIERANAAIAGIKSGMAKRVAQQKMAQADLDKTMANLKAVPGLASLKECGIVVEVVFEEFEVKKKTYAELAPHLGPDTLLCTNTSTIAITKLATAVKNPERFVGTHYFNPVPAMRLVEVIHGVRTGQAAVDQAVAFCKAIGKTPVVVKDSPAFIVNRIVGPMMNEACFLLMEGVATKEDIDTAVKLGLNHPMGPFELADLVGLDICLHEIELMYEQFADSKYRPAPLLKQMVMAGYLGRKTGKGFYDYPAKA